MMPSEHQPAQKRPPRRDLDPDNPYNTCLGVVSILVSLAMIFLTFTMKVTPLPMFIGMFIGPIFAGYFVFAFICFLVALLTGIASYKSILGKLGLLFCFVAIAFFCVTLN